MAHWRNHGNWLKSFVKIMVYKGGLFMISKWRIKASFKYGDKHWLTRLLWRLERFTRGMS